MEFDHFSLVLLETNPAAPKLDEVTSVRVFDAHLAHLAAGHDAGHMIGAGPARDGAALRGLCLTTLPPDDARAWSQTDPAVQAGVFTVRVVPWQVPAGAVAHADARFPHSVAEASG
ncbi:MAG TPA: YciI family protein [Gaiellaceae bacterium]|jgi:uncharacterized protein YciI